MMFLKNDPLRAIRLWLLSVFVMIFLMVIVGGTTRLTGSGLSMVEWHPLMGWVPPVGEIEWRAVFERYQRSPQYAQVNGWMQLGDFKRIFFWEYLHRLLGRSIGLVVGLPWLYFWAKGRLSRALAFKTGLLIVLGGLQGLLGWYMVKSGLIDVPSVSHFRLAAHLSLAFLVAQYGLWLLLTLTELRRPVYSRRRFAFAVALWLLVGVQGVYGAFMAGTHAGLIASTFPDMNGYYSPAHFTPPEGALWGALHYGPLIHWIHRAIAWSLLLFAGLGLSQLHQRPALRGLLRLVAVLLGVQFTLGVLTVLGSVPVVLAVLHQGCAYLLFSALTGLVYLTRPD